MKFEDYVDGRNASSGEGAAVVGYDGFNASASVRDLLNGLCREVRTYARLSLPLGMQRKPKARCSVSAGRCYVTRASLFVFRRRNSSHEGVNQSPRRSFPDHPPPPPHFSLPS